MGLNLPANVTAFGTPPFGDQANAVVQGQFSAVSPGLPFVFWGPFNVAIWASINTALTTTNGSLSATVASGSGLAAGDAIDSVLVPVGTTVDTASGDDITLALPSISQTGNISPSTHNVTGLAQTAGLVGATVTHPDIPSGTTVLSILTPAIPKNGTLSPVKGTIVLSQNPTAPINAAQLVFALGANAVSSGTDSNASFTGATISYSGSVQLERSFGGGNPWIVCNVGGSGAQAIWNTGTPVSLVAGEPEKGVAYRLNCTALSSGTINYRMSTTGAAALSLAVASVI